MITSPGGFDPIKPTAEGQALHGDHDYAFYQILANARWIGRAQKPPPLASGGRRAWYSIGADDRGGSDGAVLGPRDRQRRPLSYNRNSNKDEAT